MKILKNGIMPDGTKIQIEEWQEDYEFMPYGATIASYPISKTTHKGSFSPKKGKSYRFTFSFKTAKDTDRVFNDLINNNKKLTDLKDNFDGKKEYLDCF